MVLGGGNVGGGRAGVDLVEDEGGTGAVPGVEVREKDRSSDLTVTGVVC